MAQLKDLIVTGASRLIGDVYTNKIQITKLNAPTASNGATYGAGTSGQVLMSNGTSVYWGSLATGVSGVKGNAESAYRTGQVNLTPADIGAVTGPTSSTDKQLAVFNGTSGKVIKTGSINSHSYTPAGSVAVTLNTTTVNSITAVGSLPSLTMSVSDETLSFSWSAGTLPTKGSNTTVATSVKSQTFSGTTATLSHTIS